MLQLAARPHSLRPVWWIGMGACKGLGLDQGCGVRSTVKENVSQAARVGASREEGRLWAEKCDEQVGLLEVPVDSRNISDGAIADVPVGSRGRDPALVRSWRAHRVPSHCVACTVTRV
ncbi:unnamed protein product [Clonostachys byssicola]|uniref:Uncharacterized protein n=1 Tax=Clonostachys byssicola TaxID=160290 RepID=A0A9N9UAQ9_9HYPO|nr:unnamed protein product [Clonostachys byssicola]